MKKIRFQPQLSTIWFADGKKLSVQVTKVENNGIQILNREAAEFINASELSTVDRVRFGFGTHKETAWVDRVKAHEAKHK